MLKSWKLKEVVLISVFAVVFAVVYLLFVQVGNIWAGVIGPLRTSGYLGFGLLSRLFVHTSSANQVPLFCLKPWPRLLK